MGNLSFLQSMDKAYYVYALIDPRSGGIFYIGMSNDPLRRYRQHLSLIENNVEKNAIIGELLDLGLEPILVILAKLESESLALKEENRLIRLFLGNGVKLTNHCPTAMTPRAKEEFIGGFKDSGRSQVDGPFSVIKRGTNWEIVETNADGGYIPLRPRRIYPEEKRTTAYLQRVRMNRKWQHGQASNPEGDDNATSETR